LLSGVRHKPAVSQVPAELPLAAVVKPLFGPMAFRIADALADEVALAQLITRGCAGRHLGVASVRLFDLRCPEPPAEDLISLSFPDR